jgi:hypothetical protein
LDSGIHACLHAHVAKLKSCSGSTGSNGFPLNLPGTVLVGGLVTGMNGRIAMSSDLSNSQFEALKARARRLRRDRRELSQSQALDLIAQERGFQNWSLLARHRVTAETPAAPPAPPKKPYLVQIRAIVRSRELGVRNNWWDEFVPADFPEAHCQPVSGMPDHFEVVGFEEGPVRRKVAKMRRVIEFMDAARLKPSKAWVRLFGRYPEARPREMDHNAVWRDTNDRYVVTTEPYGGARTIDGLRAWCEEFNWKFAVAKQGRGMWFPCSPGCAPDCGGHTRMVVMAPPKNGGDPQAIASRI